MKKIILSSFCIFTILSLASCKKDSAENYYFSMKIDNQQFSFNDTVRAQKTSSQPALLIEAISNTKGIFRGLFSAYATGQYINTTDNSAPRIIYQFTINAVVAYNNNNPVYIQLLRPDPSVNNSISMTISNVNDTYVEGTFSGVLFNGSSLSNISEGRFKVPFK